ncbi:MAG: DsbE family thiol:disulfide interchange protein [Pseudoxanthomonas sp.]
MNVPTTPRGLKPTIVVIGALLFATLLALLAYGVWHSARGDRDVLPSALLGRPAPRFRLPQLFEPDKTLSLDDLEGRPFVLNVWGSWCVECRAEHPAIARLAYSKRVRLVGYDLKDARADAIDWLSRYDNPYSDVVSDLDGRAALDWGIYGAPETFLVDARGIVRWKHVGPLDDATIERELLPRLARIEAGK